MRLKWSWSRLYIGTVYKYFGTASVKRNVSNLIKFLLFIICKSSCLSIDFHLKYQLANIFDYFLILHAILY